MIADVRPIPDSPWFLVSRMDTAEIYAPLRERLWEICILIVILLLGTGACVGMVWRQQRVLFYREQYKMADSLREKTAYLDELLNHANAPVAVCDNQLRITRFNHAFEVLTGRKAHDVIGKSLEILFPSGNIESSMKLIKNTQTGERLETVEIDILRIDDSVRTVLWNSATIFDSAGKTSVATIVQGNDITERKRAEEALAIQKRIDNIFLTIPDEEMYNEVLKVILDVMQSPFGVFGYIDEDGALVVPSMTRHIWDKCQVIDKTFRFPRYTWGDSSWPRAIREKKYNYTNEISTVTPEGHIPVQKHISLPILFHDEVIGLLQVANKETDYTEADISMLVAIAGHIAPILSARLKRERVEEALREKVEELRQALDQIKTLRGIVPICSSCKKIRDDQGYWNQVEVYVSEHTEADFTHSICPDCARKLYPEIYVEMCKDKK